MKVTMHNFVVIMFLGILGFSFFLEFGSNLEKLSNHYRCPTMEQIGWFRGKNRISRNANKEASIGKVIGISKLVENCLFSLNDLTILSSIQCFI